MENVSIVIVDKNFNVQNLQGLVIRSEENANKIKIQFPKTYEGEDLTGKIFILKCTNANGVYFETLLPKTITAEYIELLWTVTAEFTTVSGVLKIAIFAESANYSLGTTMSKVIVEESPQYSIPIDDFTVLESYMTEIRVAADEVERDRAEALDSKNVAVAAKDLAVPASVTAVDAKNIAVTARDEAEAARDIAVTAADDAVVRMAAYEGGAIAVQVEANTSAIGQNTSDLNAHKAENVSQGNPHGIDAKANKLQENWINATPLNGWVVNRQPKFYKDTLGIVHLKGLITGGATTTGTVLLNLPDGYRPSESTPFVIATYTTTTDLTTMIAYIDTSGNMTIGFVAKGALAFNISYRAG